MWRYVNSAIYNLIYTMWRYVNYTFSMKENVPAAEDFLSTLHICYPCIHFNKELPSDNNLPFVGMDVL